MASRTVVAALRPQHWRMLVVGAAHGSRVAAGGLERLLERYRPSVVFVELDRRDFRPFVEKPQDDALREAAPEIVEILRWARGEGATESSASSPSVLPVDRDQLTTRRRIAYQLAMRPMQALRAWRYWGEVPDSTDLGEWRRAFAADCPGLHEVVLEERDEFMAYRMLLHLDRRLASSYPRLPTRPSERADSDGWLVESLSRVRDEEGALVRAALQWSLDGPACGESGLWRRAEWSARYRRPETPPSEERVLVVCGPAHVQGLARHLAEALGDCSAEGGAAAAVPPLLARNAALLPRLVANADWAWPELRRGDADAAETVAMAVAALRDPSEQAEGAPAKVAGCGERGGAAATPRAAPLPQLVFLHERIRDLSWRPIAMWPVFFLAYIVFPALFFVILPAKIDIFWLTGLGRLKP